MIYTGAIQFISEACRDLSVLRPGWGPSADTQQDCLAALNEFVDSQQIDKSLIQSTVADSFTMTAGVQYYLWGPAAAPTVIGGVQYGAFVGPRPLDVPFANVVIPGGVTPVSLSMTPLSAEEFASIRVQTIPGGLPTRYYYDRSYDVLGSGVVFFWTGPLIGYGFQPFRWQNTPFNLFLNLNTPVNMPPGLGRFIRKGLALEIAPMMKMYFKIPDPLIQMIQAQFDDARIKLANYNAQPSRVTPRTEFTSPRKSAWVYAIGESNRRY